MNAPYWAWGFFHKLHIGDNMNFLNSIRPNILFLAAIGWGVVATAASAGANVMPLAGALVGGIVTTMFLLGGPPPNPKISKEIVMALVAANTHTDVRTARTMNNRDQIVITLVAIASVLTAVLGYFGYVGQTGLETIAGGLIGAIVTLAGKLVDPGDEETATQTVALELIRRLPESGLESKS